MATEPDNLVLQMLREIRATLAEHSRVLAEHTQFHAEHRQSFAELREEMRTVTGNAAYAAGFALFGRRENEATSERVAKLETRVQRLEEKLDS